MKLYIPFNMIIDTDFGVIRIIEKVQRLPEYSKNKLKSFLLKRQNENPVPEYCKKVGIELSEYTYEVILERFYNHVLKLSQTTDLISFVMNTYKLGLSNEIEITIGCDLEEEIEYLRSITSKLEYTFDMVLNSEIDLKEFDYICIKYLNQDYVDYLIETVKLEGKRLYVADYRFNTIYDDEHGINIVNPELHLDLESAGNAVCSISLYNEK